MDIFCDKQLYNIERVTAYIVGGTNPKIVLDMWDQYGQFMRCVSGTVQIEVAHGEVHVKQNNRSKFVGRGEMGVSIQARQHHAVQVMDWAVFNNDQRVMADWADYIHIDDRKEQ